VLAIIEYALYSASIQLFTQLPTWS